MSRPARINRPNDAAIGSDQRQQVCLFALEPSVIKLIALAAEAGWDEQQAVCAIMCIAALQVSDKTLFQLELIDSGHADDADISCPGSFRFRDITSPRSVTTIRSSSDGIPAGRPERQ